MVRYQDLPLVERSADTAVLRRPDEFPLVPIRPRNFPVEERDDPSALEVIGSALRLENELFSVFGREGGLPGLFQAPVGAFDPFSHLEGYEGYSHRFINANSLEEVEALKREIQREDEDKRRLAEGGSLGGTAAFMAGFLSPINLIPIGGVAYRTYRAGGSILRGAAATATAGLVASGASEAVLQGSQLTRGWEETAANMASSTFLSGLLGGGLAALSKAANAKLTLDLNELQARVDRQLIVPPSLFGVQMEAKSAQASAKVFMQGFETQDLFAEAMANLKVVHKRLLEVTGKADWHEAQRSLGQEINALEERVTGYQEAIESAPAHRRNALSREVAAATGELLEKRGLLNEVLSWRKFADEVDQARQPESRAMLDASGLAPDETIPVEKGPVAVVGHDPLAPGYLEAGEDVSGESIWSELKSTFGLAEKLRVTTPSLGVLTSLSHITRIIGLNLFESPLKLKGNAQGKVTPISVENVVKRDFNRVVNTLSQLDELYGEYRKRVAQQTGEKLSRRAFNDEVSFANRRGDAHPIPEVGKAARLVRGQVLDYFLQKAQRLGVLPEELEPATAASYLHRVYNVKKIKAQRPAFVEIVTRWLVDKENAKLASGEIDAARTPEQLRKIADQLTDRITGLPTGRLSYDVEVPDELVELVEAGVDVTAPSLPRGQGAPKAKPLKQRRFTIADEEIEAFLENDIEHVLRSYARSLSPDLALREKFGDVEMETQLRQIRDWYAEKLDDPGLSELERLNLTKERDRDLRNIAAIRDRIRGVYGLPDDPENFFVRAGKVIRDSQFYRVMGGILLNSVPDVGRHIMVNGVTRFLGKGLLPLARNIEAAKLSRAEMKKLHAAVSIASDTRAMELSDLADNYGRGTMIERLTSEGVRLTGNITGINLWNGSMKHIAGMLSVDKIIETGQALRKSGKAPVKDIERLAAGGISPEMAQRIAAQFEQYGSTVDDIRLPNTGRWMDAEAIEHLRAAVSREVDIVIVTPGQDKPLWLSTPMGKLLGQFKSFFFGSMERVLLTGLQDRDLATLNGLVTMVALGSLVYMTGQKLKGLPVSDNPLDILVEGVDRSGVTGWFFDVNNVLEKATRGRLGVSALLGKQPMSRYVSRNLSDAFLGPFAGTLQSVGQVTGAMASGEWRESDTSAARRLLPWQNVFYARTLFDAAEVRFNQFFGIDE